MDKEFLTKRAEILSCCRIKKRINTRLPAIGEHENSLYYVIKHSDKYPVFFKNQSVIKGAVIKHESMFFCVKAINMAKVEDGVLLINKIVDEVVEYSLRYEEIMFFLSKVRIFRISELIVFAYFLRRGILKELAYMAHLLKKGCEEAVVERRTAELAGMLKDIRSEESYAKACRAYSKLYQISGFRDYDDESRVRCIHAFCRIIRKSRLGEDECIEILDGMAYEATADVFLLGRRKELYAKALGVKIHKLPPLIALRSILIILPAIVGALAAGLFCDEVNCFFYILTLSVCAFIPINSYFNRFISDKAADRMPCRAKDFEFKGELILEEGTYIKEEGIRRLFGVRQLYNAGSVLTQARIDESSERGLLSRLIERENEDGMFYALLGVNRGDCKLYSNIGQGSIYDAMPSVYSAPITDLNEYVLGKKKQLKTEFSRRPVNRGEALLKLNAGLKGCYPIAALMLLLVSCLQKSFWDRMLMQLMAVVPMVISGWMGFSKRVDELLKNKGSAIRAQDITEVFKRQLGRAAFGILMLPVYGEIFLDLMRYENRKEGGFISCMKAALPCFIYAGIYIIFACAAKAGAAEVIIAAMYAAAPVLIWRVQEYKKR